MSRRRLVSIGGSLASSSCVISFSCMLCRFRPSLQSCALPFQNLLSSIVLSAALACSLCLSGLRTPSMVTHNLLAWQLMCHPVAWTGPSVLRACSLLHGLLMEKALCTVYEGYWIPVRAQGQRMNLKDRPLGAIRHVCHHFLCPAATQHGLLQPLSTFFHPPLDLHMT